MLHHETFGLCMIISEVVIQVYLTGEITFCYILDVGEVHSFEFWTQVLQLHVSLTLSKAVIYDKGHKMQVFSSWRLLVRQRLIKVNLRFV